MASAETQTSMERLRESVEKNPLDFNSWVQLLALVESEVGRWLCHRAHPIAHLTALCMHLPDFSDTRDRRVHV